MKTEQRNAVRELALSLLDVVRSHGAMGCPSGPLYARLMGSMNLETYQAIMGALVEAKALRLENHCYYIA